MIKNLTIILLIIPIILSTFYEEKESNESPKIISISPEPESDIDLDTELITTFSEPVYPVEDQYGDASFYSYYGPIGLTYNGGSIGGFFTHMTSDYIIESNTLKLKFDKASIKAPTILNLQIQHKKIIDAEGMSLDFSDLTHESKLVYRYHLNEQ